MFSEPGGLKKDSQTRGRVLQPRPLPTPLHTNTLYTHSSSSPSIKPCLTGSNMCLGVRKYLGLNTVMYNTSDLDLLVLLSPSLTLCIPCYSLG